MRVQQPSSEDLGELTSNRLFVPAMLWVLALAAACAIALFEPPLAQQPQSAMANPAPAPAAASAQPGG